MKNKEKFAEDCANYIIAAIFAPIRGQDFDFVPERDRCRDLILKELEIYEKS